MGKEELFEGRSVYEKADGGLNYEGAPTFKRSWDARVVQVLTTGNFENTFYASAKELADEAVQVIEEARQKDPTFLAQAIVYARNQGLMRIAPITASVILSAGDTKCKDLTKQIFNQVIRTPGDLQDFVAMCRTGHFRGTGRLVKTLVGDWLANISEYHVVKYGSGNQDYSLRDIYRTVRPQLEGTANDIARYVVKGELSDSLETIKAYQEFKQTKDISLIEKYNLPYEVVTAQNSSPEAWEMLATKAPFMNMLRNLNNYEKNGILNGEVKKRIIGQLTNQEAVSKSKQFPFRFLSAWRAFNGDKQVSEALHDAIDLSVTNIPELPGTTIIAPDESGSMSEPISARSQVNCFDIANMLAAAMYKKCESAYIFPFANTAVEVKVSKRDSALSIADKIKNSIGGGTSLSSPIEKAIDEKIFVDNFILLTDNESWVDHFSYNSRGATDALKEYRKKINPNVKTFLITLVPYNHKALKDEPNTWEIVGWSDNVLRYIGSQVNGTTQLEEIRKIEL